METEYKSYKLKRKMNPILNTLTIGVLLIYMILLTSSVWMFDSKGDYDELAINESITNENNRTMTLIRWDYSEADSKMQIQLRMENNNYDGFNYYVFSAVDKNKGKLQTMSVYQESEIIVVDIKDVPKRWSTISFRIATDGADPNTDYLFKIYGNDDNIQSVSHIDDETISNFYIADVNSSIEVLKDMTRKEEKLIEDCQNKILEITKAISAKTEKIEYMTEQEKAEAVNEIDELYSTIDSYDDEILESEQLIAEYNRRTEKLNEKIEMYKEK